MTISENIKEANMRLTTLIAEEIVHNYSRDCPVDTGTLQQKANYTINGEFNIQIKLQFYYKYLEWGTKNGIKPHLTFTNAFNSALDTVLVELEQDDAWLKYSKKTLRNQKNMLKVTIVDTNYPRNKNKK